MRAVVIGALALAVLAGCGGGDERPRPAPARTVLYLHEVQGDDPTPAQLVLRADATAQVWLGGGRSGFRVHTYALGAAELRRIERLAERFPWRRLDGNGIEPGGFGGSDNGVRYLLRRGHVSATFAQGHAPRSALPLVRALDAIVAGDRGREIESHAQQQNGVDVLAPTS